MAKCSCMGYMVDCSDVDLRLFALNDEVYATRSARYLQLSATNITLSANNFRYLHWAHTLILRHNGYISVPVDAFAELVNLQELDLSNNSISLIVAGSFNGLVSLRLLDLSHNQLVMLSRSSFDPLTSLRTLVLTDNALGTIPKDSFLSLSSLNVLETDAFKFCCIAPPSVNVCTPPANEFSSCSDLMANSALQVNEPN